MWAFGLAAGVVALAGGFAACGSSAATPSTTGNGDSGAGGSASDAPGSVAQMPDTGSGDDGGTSNVDGNVVAAAPGSCPNPTVTIDFSPMYSAFIPGDAMHSFQIPAVTDDGNTATWSVSDPTQAQLVAEAFNGLPGVMITVQGVGTGSTGDAGSIGQLTLVATEANGDCGSATLNITTSTENDWTIGSARYNDGVAIQLGPPPGFDGGGGGGGGGPPPDGGVGMGMGMGMGMGDGGGGGGVRFRTSDGGSFFERDGGTACTNCHGPTAVGPNNPYQNVSHTPEQTGGFSDSDLVMIFTQGILPDGGYFDPAVILTNCDGGPACTQAAYATWHSFHQWSDITPDQYPGIIVYLRSLQPESQNGTSNFGGGGGRRRDGGGPRMRPSDAGTPLDAGTE
jgi:hypothetical protein